MSKLLEMHGITKQFPGTLALDNVDFSMDNGEIVALMGENGAGKSTLMKVLAGVHSADSGSVFINGEEVHIDNPTAAQHRGIAIVHQELSIFPHRTVAENILPNRQPSKGGFIDKAAFYAEAQKYLDELGISIDVGCEARSLSTSQQQMVEIARAISMSPKILIMDEPTSSLSDVEIDNLFRVLRELRKRNLGIVYISHKMKEILAISDRIAVLRDGKNSGELITAQADENAIVKLMVGRDVHFIFPPKADASVKGQPVLQVKHLSSGVKVKDVSFEVEEGKILGIFGLIGAGRTETARTIFGLEGAYSGEILMDGKPLSVHIPKDAMAAGIAYLPEDRKVDGLFLGMSVNNNMVSSVLEKISRGGFVKDYLINDVTDKMVCKFQIKISDNEQKVGSLSGGNQQKVLISKYYEADPKVLIIDEPTRGIDVGAKSEIHKQLRELANSGHAVVVISSELIEILGLSDRVVIMCEGRVTGELEGGNMTESAAMELATKFFQGVQEAI